MTLSDTTLLQGGKYKIVRVLGQGGFGITYLAEHAILKTRVCIKEFFPRDYVDRDGTTSLVHATTQGNVELVDRLRQRFISEAKNIYQLNHPGIIRISDIFEENGTAYYVMDYVEGISLGDMVKDGRPLPEAKALEYGKKVAEALEYIHAHNMTHFDLKPDNIMLRKEDDSPVIIDFGLSKQYTQAGHAMTSIIVGISKGYSPMEQYSEEALNTFSPRFDVYSLGATVYTLLTGRVPPEARLLIRDEILLPTNISPNTIAAIQWAMKPFPEDRCPTASAFIKAISGQSVGQTKSEAGNTPPPAPGFNHTGTANATEPPAYSQAQPTMRQPTERNTSDNRQGRQTQSRPATPIDDFADEYTGGAGQRKKKRSGKKIAGIILGSIFGSIFIILVLCVIIAIVSDDEPTNQDEDQPTAVHKSQRYTDEAEEAGEDVAANEGEADEQSLNNTLTGLPASIVENGYAQKRSGKNAYYYSGYFSDGDKEYPVKLVFMVSPGNDDLTVEYKNVDHRAQMMMDVQSYNDDEIVLKNSKNNFEINLTNGGGKKLAGSAVHGDKILSVEISPTWDTF